ncbi:MAG: hypothetical protein ACO3B3_02800 [Cyanobium sp.]
MLWLTGAQRAAQLERTNQSTIVRRAQAVKDLFEVTIRRDPCGWSLSGDTQLLRLERLLHQRARLLGRRPLRLQTPYWTQRGRLRRLPQGWITNPPSAATACENPLELLRARVIDAALLTPTQLTQAGDDLITEAIYVSQIELTVFPETELSDPQGVYQTLRDRGELVLRLPPFLPSSCLQRCRVWFNQLRPRPALSGVAVRPIGAGQVTPELSVAFLTPEMRRVQERPFLVDPTHEPRPYAESLVVLAELAEEAAVVRLRDHLSTLFRPDSPQRSALLRRA